MLYDIILVIFIMLLAWLSKRRGLFRSLMGFCSSIIAIIATALCREPVIAFIKTTPFYESVEKLIAPTISKSITPDTSSLPKIIADAANGASGAASGVFVQFIMAALITILLYLAILLVLRLLTGALDRVFKLPVLKQFNSLGGFLFGALTAFILVYASLAVWGCFTAFRIPSQLADTGLLKSMFENNLLMIIFS